MIVNNEQLSESQAREKAKTLALYKRKLIEIKVRIEMEFIEQTQKSLNRDKRKNARLKAIEKHGNQNGLNSIKNETIQKIVKVNSKLLDSYNNEIGLLKSDIITLTNQKFYYSAYTVGLQILLDLINNEGMNSSSFGFENIEFAIRKDIDENIYIGLNEAKESRNASINLLLDFAILAAIEAYDPNINTNTNFG